MRRIFLISFSLLIISQLTYSQNINDWRPENRTGVSSEQGLLKSWPSGGPSLLWTNLELGKGYSSPSFGKNTIYITGVAGKEDVLYAIGMDGKLLWKSVMGRSWTGSFPESRTTPTVEGNKVYTCSSFGDIACFDGADGKMLWSYKGSELNKGTFGTWGIAESLLIDGDKLFFSPGGPETMTIALNKNTGSVIWKSASLNDKPGYVSPILINYAGKKVVVNISLGHVFGVDASNGDILWKVALNPDSRDELIKCTTPLYNNGMVYVTGGYNEKAMMVRIAPDGKSAATVWTDEVLDNHHGGVVLLNGYIYGSNWLNNGDGNWCCIEWATGKKMWEEHWNCKGPIISAEGLLYIFDERKGNLGLVKASPEKFEVISSFQVTQGNSGPFWAHPVIHNGILYVRHTNALMAYNIKLK